MRNLIHRFMGQQGMALPAALSVMLLVASLTAVAAASSITATSQSLRDRTSKRAIAAVQAGVDAALDGLGATGADPNACPLGSAPFGAGWCAVTDTLGDGERYYTYTSIGTETRVACQTAQTRRIVSIGAARIRDGWVTRRAVATVSSRTGSVFSDCAVISPQRFNANDKARLHGNLATNGLADLDTKSSICGNVNAEELKLRPPNARQDCGQDLSPNNPPNPYKLLAVKKGCAPGKAWRDPECNNNDRIGVEDPLVDNQTGAPVWDTTDRPRELVLTQQSTLTLTGNVYSFCFLRLADQSQLIVAPRDNGTVRIFIDSPENCPGRPAVSSPGNLFLNLAGQGTILNTNADPTTLQIYMLGSDDPGQRYGTKAAIKNNPQDRPGSSSLDTYMNFVLYAPRSRVVLGNSARILGAVAGKRVSLVDRAHLIWSGEVTKLNGSNFSVVPSFTIDSWAECPPPPLTIYGPSPFVNCVQQ